MSQQDYQELIVAFFRDHWFKLVVAFVAWRVWARVSDYLERQRRLDSPEAKAAAEKANLEREIELEEMKARLAEAKRNHIAAEQGRLTEEEKHNYTTVRAKRSEELDSLRHDADKSQAQLDREVLDGKRKEVEILADRLEADHAMDLEDRAIDLEAKRNRVLSKRPPPAQIEPPNPVIVEIRQEEADEERIDAHFREKLGKLEQDYLNDDISEFEYQIRRREVERKKAMASEEMGKRRRQGDS